MMPHHWRPLAHERNSIFKCKQHTCTLHDLLRTRKIWLHNDVVRGDFLHDHYQSHSLAMCSNCFVSISQQYLFIVYFELSVCLLRLGVHVFLCCSVCLFLLGPLCHGALKLDLYRGWCFLVHSMLPEGFPFHQLFYLHCLQRSFFNISLIYIMLRCCAAKQIEKQQLVLILLSCPLYTFNALYLSLSSRYDLCCIDIWYNLAFRQVTADMTYNFYYLLRRNRYM